MTSNGPDDDRTTQHPAAGSGHDAPESRDQQFFAWDRRGEGDAEPTGSSGPDAQAGPASYPTAAEGQPWGQDHYGQNRYGQNQYGQSQYGQSQGEQSQYGQSQGDQGQHGQDAYGQSRYSQDPYGQDPYGQNRYAQGPYGQDQQVYHAAQQPAAPAAPVALAQPRRKRRSRGGILVAAAVIAAVFGSGAAIGTNALVSGSSRSGSAPISVSTTQATSAPALNGTIEAAAAKIEPSVVTITVRNGNSGDIGSGVVLDKQGHILTNNHVVAAESAQTYGQSGSTNTTNTQITVTFNNGKTASATVVGTATTEDLAVIKVNDTADLVPATFANSSSLKVGQTVVAAGAPLGLSETITSGIVSTTARPVRSGNNNDAVYLAVQTDAPINPGNSGGPLVDLNGQVVGINSSIASTSNSDSGGQAGNIGIGFSIPSDVVTRVAQQLINTGKSTDAALGVTVSGTAGEQFGATTTGVPLATVRAGGAAAAAGLKAGDKVTAINDFKTTSADGLIAATRFYAPGTKVNVTYTRNGTSTTVPITLGTV